jgi:hypothetical protein
MDLLLSRGTHAVDAFFLAATCVSLVESLVVQGFSAP